jgi:hypothetical protein
MLITSLHQILGHEIPMAEIKEKLHEIMVETFSLSIRDVSWREVQEVLASGNA